MGKNAKEHRKRVQKRNNRIKMEQKHYEKKMNDLFMKQMEMMKKSISENPQTNENEVGSVETEKSE